MLTQRPQPPTVLYLGQHGAGQYQDALAGTYHHVSAKHAQRYLAIFAWRFNRRYQLDSLPSASLCLRADSAASLPGHHRRMRKTNTE